MKRSDIAMIVLIAGFGIMVAYFIAVNIPFLKLPENGVEVQKMRELTSEVAEPDEKVFNSRAINPTVEVIVGQGGAN